MSSHLLLVYLAEIINMRFTSKRVTCNQIALRATHVAAFQHFFISASESLKSPLGDGLFAHFSERHVSSTI
jgi:hypothetical protein